MTNEEIKNQLLKLEPTDIDFSVTMTGKASNKVNGLYKPATKEILLHNLNFKTSDQLIYTAIHEYTHHLINVEQERNDMPKKTKSHDTEFWAKFDSLLDKAIELKIFTRERSPELQNKIEAAKELDKEIAKMQKKLGQLLMEIKKQSDDENIRYEDVLSHDMRMSRKTATKALMSSFVSEENVNQDEQEILSVSRKKGLEAYNKVKSSLDDGKSLNQAKDFIQKKVEKSKLKLLEDEQQRIEKTIRQLQLRLDFIKEKLEAA